ncbi:unnamed protein product [Amoebophrya sp. A120]|nr:unnamed protein product [Amoebophrya sp. A120]|eukprot:GSA120T00018788001.1
MRDAIGEAYHNAYVDGFSCTSQRRMMFDAWCGVADGETKAAWVSSASNTALHDSQILPPIVVGKNSGLRSDLNKKYLVEEPKDHLTWDLEAGKFLFKRELEEAWGRLRDEEGKKNRKNDPSLTKRKKYVVFGCHAGAYACGGHGDRWNGIFVSFLLAIVLGREFLIDMPDPIALSNFLVPARDPFTGEKNVDWVVTDEKRERLRLLRKKAYLLWDYDEFKQKYFREFLESDEEVLLIYTNKKSFFGQVYRYLFYEKRVITTEWVRMPYLMHYMFEYLFQPSLHMLKRMLFLRNPYVPFDTDELNQEAVQLAAQQHYLQLAERWEGEEQEGIEQEMKQHVDVAEKQQPMKEVDDLDAPQEVRDQNDLTSNSLDVFREYFIGIHYRAGDLVAGFGQVNEDLDIRHGTDMLVRMLGCAAEVERVLELEMKNEKNSLASHSKLLNLLEDHGSAASSSTTKNSTASIPVRPRVTVKWYLATDNAAVLSEVPQIRSWIQQGKIVHNGNLKSRTHLSQFNNNKTTTSAGTTTTEGAADLGEGGNNHLQEQDQRIRGDPSRTKLDEIRGVSDGWLDFQVLSKAVAVIASSSAFGLVASQVGAVPYVFSADSCIRIDLQ